MKFGNFELSIVRECTYKLDGGAYFGVVPKPLWSKVAEPDERNRVLLSCNLLLSETGAKRICVDLGMGDRWDDRERERYEIKSLVRSEHVFSSLGLANSDIDAVILSHLHFDHAGGATRFDGEKLVPTFPNAVYYVQRGDWEFAHNANPRARGSYRKDDFEPLKDHGVLKLIDGDLEIEPGVWCRVSGGHTSHHQIALVESEGKKAVFFADIIPTPNHLSPPWVMGYDHYPLQCCDIKQEWLTRAAAEDWLIVFDHETGVPWGHVKEQYGKFVFSALPQETLNFREPASI